MATYNILNLTFNAKTITKLLGV